MAVFVFVVGGLVWNGNQSDDLSSSNDSSCETAWNAYRSSPAYTAPRAPGFVGGQTHNEYVVRCEAGHEDLREAVRRLEE